jgi:hypothetical protein
LNAKKGAGCISTDFRIDATGSAIAGHSPQTLEFVMKEISEDALLTREEVAKALTERGFKIAAPTLATRATRGGGPAYQIFNKYAMYRWATTLAWARSRLSNPRRSTSEGDLNDADEFRRPEAGNSASSRKNAVSV